MNYALGDEQLGLLYALSKDNTTFVATLGGSWDQWAQRRACYIDLMTHLETNYPELFEEYGMILKQGKLEIEQISEGTMFALLSEDLASVRLAFNKSEYQKIIKKDSNDLCEIPSL